jgi:glycosyltransferase involved in cell wall biosynthesis
VIRVGEEVMDLLRRSNGEPFVSVVIPSYNHERYIGEAVESVLASTFQDFEIVVVDDGSTDRSLEVIRGFKDLRIRLFDQQNTGAHAAINRGVALASAPWIAVLNSDDRYHPRKLQQHVELHEKNPGLEASASRIRHISGSGAPLDTDGYISWRYGQLKDIHRRLPSLKSSLLAANHLITSSALFISKQGFNEVGGFIPLRYVHDWFFFLTLASRGHFTVLEEPLVDYRVHGKNTIRENDDRGMIEDNFVLEWHLCEDSTRRPSASDIFDLFDILEQNKRASYRLILLFQRWRRASDNDLAKCAALLEDPAHPLMQLALKLIRKERRSSYYLKLLLRRALGEHLWSVVADHAVKGIRTVQNCLASLVSPRKKS